MASNSFSWLLVASDGPQVAPCVACFSWLPSSTLGLTLLAGPHKIELIYKCLIWDLSMIITDIDALVLREPFQFMNRWARGPSAASPAAPSTATALTAFHNRPSTATAFAAFQSLFPLPSAAVLLIPQPPTSPQMARRRLPHHNRSARQHNQRRRVRDAPRHIHSPPCHTAERAPCCACCAAWRRTMASTRPSTSATCSSESRRCLWSRSGAPSSRCAVGGPSECHLSPIGRPSGRCLMAFRMPSNRYLIAR